MTKLTSMTPRTARLKGVLLLIAFIILILLTQTDRDSLERLVENIGGGNFGTARWEELHQKLFEVLNPKCLPNGTLTLRIDAADLEALSQRLSEVISQEPVTVAVGDKVLVIRASDSSLAMLDQKRMLNLGFSGTKLTVLLQGLSVQWQDAAPTQASKQDALRATFDLAYVADRLSLSVLEAFLGEQAISDLDLRDFEKGFLGSFGSKLDLWRSSLPGKVSFSVEDEAVVISRTEAPSCENTPSV